MLELPSHWFFSNQFYPLLYHLSAFKTESVSFSLVEIVVIVVVRTISFFLSFPSKIEKFQEGTIIVSPSHSPTDPNLFLSLLLKLILTRTQGVWMVKEAKLNFCFLWSWVISKMCSTSHTSHIFVCNSKLVHNCTLHHPSTGDSQD